MNHDFNFYFSFTIAERVRRGMTLLDAYRPGWDKNIDLTTLDQSRATHCVVGQTFDDFCAGLAEMGIGGVQGQTSSYGFASGFSADTDADFRLLTDEFRKRIMERRSRDLSGEAAFTDEALIEAARKGTVDLLLLVMSRPETDRVLIESAVSH